MDRSKMIVFMIAFTQGTMDLYQLPLFYFYKDSLKTSAARLSAIQGLMLLPWTIKPLFGFISDHFPIFGYRRKSYIILASSIEILLLLYLAFFADSLTLTTMCQILLISCMVFRNVIGEAMIVCLSKKNISKMNEEEQQDNAQANVSIYFGAKAIGSLIASFCTGYFAQYTPHFTSFTICAAMSFLLIILIIVLYKEEFEIAADENFVTNLKKIGKVVIDPRIRGLLGVVMLILSTPAYDQLMNYFYTESLKFSPELMGHIVFVGALAYLLGIISMNTLFRGIPFKSFYITTTFFSAATSFFTLVLVKRWNVLLGIGDIFFCISSNALTSFICELNFLPILAFSCRLCPQGLEGTTYAVFTALFNLVYYISTQFGTVLIVVFGVTRHDFSNLGLLIVIQLIYNFGFAVLILFVTFPKLDSLPKVVVNEGELESLNQYYSERGSNENQRWELEPRLRKFYSIDNNSKNNISYLLSTTGANLRSFN